ncbi:MAG: nucleotidyltransferase family protein [Roseiflexaceae bacterium]
MPTPAHSSPNLPRISATVIGWLTEPAHLPLAPQLEGWDAADWQAARWAVQVHGIGPLLDHAAARWLDADALHSTLRSYLAEQRCLSAERVTLLLHDLAEILFACEQEQIAAIPLKGSLLATHYYAEPGLRPMNDLDLLVRPADEQRMLRLLTRLGYQLIARSQKHLMLARPEAHGPVVSYTGEHPDNPRSLDLHTRLAEYFWGIRYDLTDEAWADSAPSRLQDVEARVLGPTTLLHHLAIHASSDAIARRLRLLHLADIALVAAKLDPADWERIVAGAQRRGEQRLVYPALLLTSRYYPVVPAAVLGALRSGVPSALLQQLDATSLDQLSFCNRLPTTPAEKLRWFRPGYEQVRALRHMLLPNPGELAHWYPKLTQPALLPIAYLRYGARILGWGVRRARGKSRLGPGVPLGGVDVRPE